MKSKLIYWRPGVMVIGPLRSLLHTLGLVFLIIAGNVTLAFLECDANTYFTNNLRYASILLILLVVYIAFVDPGFFRRDSISQRVYEKNVADETLACERCLTLKSDNTRHCIMCDCCVKNLDHHCDVFGNCIGRPNLVCFWLAVLLGCLCVSVLYFSGFKYISACTF